MRHGPFLVIVRVGLGIRFPILEYMGVCRICTILAGNMPKFGSFGGWYRKSFSKSRICGCLSHLHHFGRKHA